MTMINKNLVSEVLVMLGFFIGLDTFFWIKKDEKKVQSATASKFYC